jgi:hypothetical protein
VLDRPKPKGAYGSDLVSRHTSSNIAGTPRDFLSRGLFIHQVLRAFLVSTDGQNIAAKSRRVLKHSWLWHPHSISCFAHRSRSKLSRVRPEKIHNLLAVAAVTGR